LSWIVINELRKEIKHKNIWLLLKNIRRCFMELKRISFLVISTCDDAIDKCSKCIAKLPKWFKFSIPSKPKRTGRGFSGGGRRLRR
jgi:hypothetical protein